MKKHFHIKTVQVPLYVGKFVLILSNDLDSVKKSIPQMSDETTLFGHAAFGTHKGSTAYFMVLNFDDSDKITHGTIAHEAHHIVSYIFSHHGIEYDISNDEPAAYLLSWVVNTVYKFLHEKNFKSEIK